MKGYLLYITFFGGRLPAVERRNLSGCYLTRATPTPLDSGAATLNPIAAHAVAAEEIH